MLDGADGVGSHRAVVVDEWSRLGDATQRAAAGPDVPAISAGNYGGKLGKFQFPLHAVLRAD